MNQETIEKLVDAIGEALGVKMMFVQPNTLEAARDVARVILIPDGVLAPAAEDKLQELVQAVRLACHHVNNGLVPLMCEEPPPPSATRIRDAMKELSVVQKRVANGR